MARRSTKQKRIHVDSDIVGSYLKDVGRYPLLTPEQEVILGRQVQAMMAIASRYGDELDNSVMSRMPAVMAECTPEERRIIQTGMRARTQFINSNLRLVVAQVKKHSARFKNNEHRVGFMDLIEEGNLGLMRAVEKFDCSKGYKFSTYATWWIRQALNRTLDTRLSLIAIPVWVAEAERSVRKAVRILQTQGLPVTAEAVSGLSGQSLEKLDALKKVRHQFGAVLSLDHSYNIEDDDHSLIECISDGQDDLLDQLAKAEIQQSVQQTIASFPEAGCRDWFWRRLQGEKVSVGRAVQEYGVEAKRVRKWQRTGSRRLQKVGVHLIQGTCK